METTNDQLINEYLLQLTEKEKKAYIIASSHLGTSFNIAKSIGFINWLKSKK